ncbi:MAG: metal ABC transporter permease [Coleofasciculaceae cyanobacterium SM2_1_6]|nr:metal ABC transporter permease [Coleofasciculaceae cyanobacterium SM2_1_6]
MEIVWQWFTAPLQFQFMVQALFVSVLVGAICAVLSCYLTLKGWALMGDAVSHAVLPGVVLAYGLQIPLALGAFVFGLGSVLLIGLIKARTRVKEDAAIGLVFTGFFAFGLVLISKLPSNIDLMHILFGNLLGISPENLIQTIVITVIATIGLFIFRKDLLLFCFDPVHARTIGLNTAFLYYLLLIILALTIVAAQQTVGIILVISMLITPGSTAYLLTDNFDRMTILAVLSAVFSSVLGTYLSYHFDASPAGCIVVLQTLIFLMTMIFAPKYGLIARR